jgi:TPR repeat protein
VSSSSNPSASSYSDVEADPTIAMHYLHLSARRGVPEADYEIAHELLWKSGELTEQHKKLAYAHTARALLGDVPLANGLMGKILEEGIGCKKNLVEAEEFYFRGRKEGDDWARSRSDYLLNQGVGVNGVEAGTYKKPTAAERKVAARNYQSVY